MPVHEVGVHEGQHYFSMDYIEGRSMAEIVCENPPPAGKAAEYVQKISEAVHSVHQQGTLHRDLKPSNVFIDRNDEVHGTDFGLAVLWVPAFIHLSQAAMLAALFSQLDIRVHYYCTELPDVAYIYGDRERQGVTPV